MLHNQQACLFEHLYRLAFCSSSFFTKLVSFDFRDIHDIDILCFADSQAGCNDFYEAFNYKVPLIGACCNCRAFSQYMPF